MDPVTRRTVRTLPTKSCWLDLQLPTAINSLARGSFFPRMPSVASARSRKESRFHIFSFYEPRPLEENLARRFDIRNVILGPGAGNPVRRWFGCRHDSSGGGVWGATAWPRRVHSKVFLPVLIDALHGAGIAGREIFIGFAHGNHRPRSLRSRAAWGWARLRAGLLGMITTAIKREGSFAEKNGLRRSSHFRAPWRVSDRELLP